MGVVIALAPVYDQEDLEYILTGTRTTKQLPNNYQTRTRDEPRNITTKQLPSTLIS